MLAFKAISGLCINDCHWLIMRGQAQLLEVHLTSLLARVSDTVSLSWFFPKEKREKAGN